MNAIMSLPIHLQTSLSKFLSNSPVGTGHLDITLSLRKSLYMTLASREIGGYRKKVILPTVAATPGGDMRRSIELDLSPTLKNRKPIHNAFAPPETPNHKKWYQSSTEYLGIRWNRTSSDTLLSAEIGFIPELTNRDLMQKEIQAAMNEINNKIDRRGGDITVLFQQEQPIVMLAFYGTDGYHRATFSDDARMTIAEFSKDIIERCGA